MPLDDSFIRPRDNSEMNNKTSIQLQLCRATEWVQYIDYYNYSLY